MKEQKQPNSLLLNSYMLFFSIAKGFVKNMHDMEHK